MGEIHQYPSDISREEYNLIREDLEGAKNNPAQKTGIKRHVIVDTRGLPHAITVTTADVTDRDRAIQMILLNLDNLSHVEKFLVDAGYSGERFANQVKDICGAQVDVVKRSELHKFVVLPRRWVVERLFGWLDKFRRLWKNCERKLYISAQILTFALIAILIRRF